MRYNTDSRKQGPPIEREGFVCLLTSTQLKIDAGAADEQGKSALLRERQGRPPNYRLGDFVVSGKLYLFRWRIPHDCVKMGLGRRDRVKPLNDGAKSEGACPAKDKRRPTRKNALA